MSDENTARKEAIETAGSCAALAELLIPKATNEDKKRLEWAILKWKKVPPHWVLSVEKVTGVPRSRLRPDLYPPDEAA